MALSPAVEKRQRIERRICMAVVDALLAAGYSLGVFDGEERTITFSKDRAAIRAALFTTDEDHLLVYSREPEKNTTPDMWVRFTYGNDGWDVVSDYSHSDTLGKYIGEGTEVEKLIDKLEEEAR